MQTRYMERSNSMAREKRGLDSAAAEEGQPDRKRPALARFSVCFLPRNWTRAFSVFFFFFVVCVFLRLISWKCGSSVILEVTK